MTLIEENNKRLQNLKDTVAGLSLETKDVQTTLKLISDCLTVKPQPQPKTYLTEQKINTVKLEAEFRGDQEFLDWL